MRFSWELFGETCKLKKKKENSVGNIFCYKAMEGLQNNVLMMTLIQSWKKYKMSHRTVKKRKLVNSIIYCKNCNQLSHCAHLMDFEIALQNNVVQLLNLSILKLLHNFFSMKPECENQAYYLHTLFIVNIYFLKQVAISWPLAITN